ncbi:MAG: response regulator [candidate division KSB1 bacterium]|nr:response regulator [candidate division KSB1 bacterium]MDZ7334701.1 response regulator [candidate division KSB1 bacterium]MDZ7356205.1 response regulator [candidate division KSB1 bacterium]MDZ7377206.1 response regulator [candidate division KSB1 bacterium]MDZ7400348.1 response regulator [candidate division KSB1 bacterium]
MATTQKRILVVNDEREMLDQIHRWLTLAGYVVKCTNTAEDGIRIFRETHFDLVLLDYNLKQERNGARTAKTFIPRFKQLNPTIPIIIISATESRLDKDELGVAGVMILHQAIWKELANEIAKIIPT